MPAMDGFLSSGDYGQVTLAKQWNVSYGVLVTLVVFMAVAAFLASEWAEVKTGSRELTSQPLLGMKGLTRSRGLMLAFIGVGVVAATAGSPYRGHDVRVNEKELGQMVSRQADHVTVDDLAGRLIAGTNVPRLIDLREPGEFGRYHLPGAENVPMATLASAQWRADESVLLYSGSDAHAEQAWLMLKARRLPQVYTVEGGLDAWNDRVLFPRLTENPAPGEVDAQKRKVAVSNHCGGTPRGGAAPGEVKDAAMSLPPPPPAEVPAGGDAAPKKKAKKEGC